MVERVRVPDFVRKSKSIQNRTVEVSAASSAINESGPRCVCEVSMRVNKSPTMAQHRMASGIKTIKSLLSASRLRIGSMSAAPQALQRIDESVDSRRHPRQQKIAREDAQQH